MPLPGSLTKKKLIGIKDADLKVMACMGFPISAKTRVKHDLKS
jgi:hypothetical protein